MTGSGYVQKEAAELRELLKQRERYESVLMEITLKFVGPVDPDVSLEEVLKIIQEFSGADRAIIMQVDEDDPDHISMTHEACKQGIRPVKHHVKGIPFKKNKWFEKIQREKGSINIPDTSRLPDEAINEKNLFRKNGIGASLITSFTSQKMFRGNLALHSDKPVGKWSREVVNMLIHTSVLIEHSLKRWETERALIDAKQQAEKSDKLKSNFLANLSHEIRTPLNGIVGFSKLLSTRKFEPAKQEEIARLIEANSEQLIHVINDLLDLARIESNSILLVHERIPVSLFLHDLYGHFQDSPLRNKDIRFLLQIDKEVSDLEIMTDRKRLHQILEQFIKNAFRFTQIGSVILGAAYLKDSFEIYVEDSGSGITRKNLNRIFERFWQIDSKDVRPYSGNGLGLSLARDFATLLGTEIKVKSKPGKGSRFSVLIPLEMIVPPGSNFSEEPARIKTAQIQEQKLKISPRYSQK